MTLVAVLLEREGDAAAKARGAPAPLAGPEERRTVYSMLGARVEALPDKNLRIRGAFGEENSVCHHDRTSRRSSPDANPARPTRLRFTLISRDGELETAFKLDYNVSL